MAKDPSRRISTMNMLKDELNDELVHLKTPLRRVASNVVPRVERAFAPTVPARQQAVASPAPLPQVQPAPAHLPTTAPMPDAPAGRPRVQPAPPPLGTTAPRPDAPARRPRVQPAPAPLATTAPMHDAPSSARPVAGTGPAAEIAPAALEPRSAPEEPGARP